jgi:hypothetical protein
MFSPPLDKPEADKVLRRPQTLHISPQIGLEWLIRIATEEDECCKNLY